jgi:hypothetical protein
MEDITVDEVWERVKERLGRDSYNGRGRLIFSRPGAELRAGFSGTEKRGGENLPGRRKRFYGGK